MNLRKDHYVGVRRGDEGGVGEARRSRAEPTRPNSTDRSPGTKTVVLWRRRRMWGRGLGGLVWGGWGKMARGRCWYGRWGVVVQTTTPCWLDLSAVASHTPLHSLPKKPHTPRPRVSLQPMCTLQSISFSRAAHSLAPPGKNHKKPKDNSEQWISWLVCR